MKKFSYCINGGIMTITCAVIAINAGMATVQPIRAEFCGSSESWAANCVGDETCVISSEDLQEV